MVPVTMLAQGMFELPKSVTFGPLGVKNRLPEQEHTAVNTSCRFPVVRNANEAAVLGVMVVNALSRMQPPAGTMPLNPTAGPALGVSPLLLLL